MVYGTFCYEKRSLDCGGEFLVTVDRFLIKLGSFEFFQICRPATEFAAGIGTGYRSWIVKLGFEATPSRIH